MGDTIKFIERTVSKAVVRFFVFTRIAKRKVIKHKREYYGKKLEGELRLRLLKTCGERESANIS